MEHTKNTAKGDKKMGQENALVPVPQEGSGALATISSADLAEMHETMSGFDLRLPKITILHQAQMFEMGTGEKVTEFVGRILDITKPNAWWASSFDESGGGSPPQCFSADGVMPDAGSEDPQSNTTCTACPQNQFGSDGGRGKACKNSRMIHILLPESILPCRITLPPSNMKALDSYATSLAMVAQPYYRALTRFKIKKVQNKDGIAYGEISLGLVEIAPKQEWAAIKNLRDSLLPLMRGEAPVVKPGGYN